MIELFPENANKGKWKVNWKQEHFLRSDCSTISADFFEFTNTSKKLIMIVESHKHYIKKVKNYNTS